MDAPPIGRHLGDLQRGDTRWSVFLETVQEPQPGARHALVRGRLHFASQSRRRSTGWIFLEWSEQELMARFNQFSPAELWQLLDSIP